MRVSIDWIVGTPSVTEIGPAGDPATRLVTQPRVRAHAWVPRAASARWELEGQVQLEAEIGAKIVDSALGFAGAALQVAHARFEVADRWTERIGDGLSDPVRVLLDRRIDGLGIDAARWPWKAPRTSGPSRPGRSLRTSRWPRSPTGPGAPPVPFEPSLDDVGRDGRASGHRKRGGSENDKKQDLQRTSRAIARGLRSLGEQLPQKHSQPSPSPRTRTCQEPGRIVA
jgi:hypothetical protein